MRGVLRDVERRGRGGVLGVCGVCGWVVLYDGRGGGLRGGLLLRERRADGVCGDGLEQRGGEDVLGAVGVPGRLGLLEWHGGELRGWVVLRGRSRDSVACGYVQRWRPLGVHRLRGELVE